jgi:hypothetical protein
VNIPVGALQVNLACTLDIFQNADEKDSNYFGSRLGKDNVRNAERRKLSLLREIILKFKWRIWS